MARIDSGHIPIDGNMENRRGDKGLFFSLLDILLIGDHCHDAFAAQDTVNCGSALPEKINAGDCYV